LLISIPNDKYKIVFFSDPPTFLKHGGRIQGYKTVLPSVAADQVHSCILISEFIDFLTIPSFDGRITGLSCHTAVGALALFSVYIQPVTGAGLDYLKQQIQEYKVTHHHHIIFIGGDFNARHPLWGDIENRLGSEVANWIEYQDLTILNKFPCPPTYMNSKGHCSWIDLSITSDNGLALRPEWRVFSTTDGFSDHRTVKTTLHIGEKPRLIEKARNWRKADWSNIQKAVKVLLRNTYWKPIVWEETSIEDLDYLVCRFSSELLEITNEWVPTSRRGTLRKPWWSDEIASQHRKTKRMFRKAERSQNEIRKTMLTVEAKRERRTLKRMIRQAKRTSWIEFVTNSPRDDLWKTFKRVTRPKTSCTISYIKTSNGTILSDPEKIMDELAGKFFPSNADCSSQRNSPATRQLAAAPPASEEEVKKAVFKGKPFGAPGLDGIPNVLLRRLYPILKDSIAGIFNAVLRLQHFPRIWRTAKVVTVPKTSGGYRPISLLNTLGKAFEALISARFAFKIEKMLHDNQHGFRKQRSTQTALLSLLKKLEENKAKRRVTYGATLDISAAFDSVSPGKLVQSAADLNLPSYMVNLIDSFTTERQAALTIGGIHKTYRVQSGTPQGSPWSPSLFTMYLNPALQLELDRASSAQAFADDLFVTATGRSDSEAQTLLQTAINKIITWTDKANLRLNPMKCSTIRFTPKKWQGETLPISIEKVNLESKNSIKYLGVILDSKLSFKPHLEAMARKCMSRLTEFKKLAKLYWGTDPRFLATLVKKAIEPAIYYGSSCLMKSVRLRSNLKLLHKAVRLCGIFVSGCLKTTPYNSVHLLSGLRDPASEVESRALSQSRLLKVYGFDDLMHADIGKSHYIPPENDSFTVQIHVETRRLKRIAQKEEVLQATRLVPWGIPPENSDLLISPAPKETQLPTTRYQTHASAIADRSNGKLTAGWAVLQAGHYISDSITLDQDRCRGSAELHGILQALYVSKSLGYKDKRAEREIILHITSRAAKHLTKTSNINIIAFNAQQLIADIKRSGTRIYWNTVKSTYPAKALRETILKASNQTRRPQSIPSDIGWDIEAFNRWRKGLADNKVQSYCEGYDAGRSLSTTGMTFSSKNFPAAECERRDGSRISQFLSNHFPSKEYLRRFQLIPAESTSSCACDEATESRDHLLFSCPLLTNVRDDLSLKLGEDMTWENILNNPPRLLPIVNAIAKLWTDQGRRWG